MDQMFAAALSPLLVCHFILTLYQPDKVGLDNGQSVQGTYAYKSSNFANGTNLALDNDLFAKFANPNATFALYPVTYHL